MLGIIPAAGGATRLQPLGGAKELLPLGQGAGPRRRLRVVADFLLERMVLAGADRLCFVVSPDKGDLLRYFARSRFSHRLEFVLQPSPAGLCDAIFRAAPLVREREPVLIGLPDTIWYPRQALAAALRPVVHLVTFPVASPEHFDAVVPLAAGGSVAPDVVKDVDRDVARDVARIEVKVPGDAARRVWGAVTAPGREFLELAALWHRRCCRDQYLGHLLNAWIEAGHRVSFDAQGTHYWDLGTPEGYAVAWRDRVWEEPASPGVPHESMAAVRAAGADDRSGSAQNAVPGSGGSEPGGGVCW